MEWPLEEKGSCRERLTQSWSSQEDPPRPLGEVEPESSSEPAGAVGLAWCLASWIPLRKAGVGTSLPLLQHCGPVQDERGQGEVRGGPAEGKGGPLHRPHGTLSDLEMNFPSLPFPNLLKAGG